MMEVMKSNKPIGISATISDLKVWKISSKSKNNETMDEYERQMEIKCLFGKIKKIIEKNE